MKTDSFTAAEETATTGAAEGWAVLVDEPPPLDWDLEDLLPPGPDATATSILHIGLLSPATYEPGVATALAAVTGQPHLAPVIRKPLAT